MTTPSETALSAEDEAVARLRSLIENVVTTDEYRAAYRDALAILVAARSQPATEGLRAAADRLLSLIDTANVPRTATTTLARTGTLLEAIESLRAALAATEPAGDESEFYDDGQRIMPEDKR